MLRSHLARSVGRRRASLTETPPPPLGLPPAYIPGVCGTQRSPAAASSGKVRRRWAGGTTPTPPPLLLVKMMPLILLMMMMLMMSGLRVCNAAAAASSSASSSSSDGAPPPTHVSPSCPAACECSEQARTVKCVSRELAEPPRGLPAYTRTLYVTGNSLSAITAGGAFSRDAAWPLHSLNTLDLSSNRVERLEAGAFAGLPALRLLDLSNNALRSVHPDALSGLGSLRELVLNRALARPHHRPRNSTALPPPPPSSWSCLSGLCAALRSARLLNLRRLSLSGNRLLVLPPRELLLSLPSLAALDLSNNSVTGGLDAGPGAWPPASLASLASIDLSENALATPDAAAFARLRSAAAAAPAPPGLSLRLRDNPFACDCELAPFVAWLPNATGFVADGPLLRCRRPPALAGRPLAGLRADELPCPGGGPSAGDVPAALRTSYVFLGLVLALVGLVFLLVLYLNRRGIKLWAEGVRQLCRDHMQASYHYRYEHEAPDIAGDMRRLSAAAAATAAEA